MPGIGRPKANNPFSGIQMAKKAPNNKKSVGDQLNKMAGVRPEQQFVDRKTHNKLGKDGFLKLLSHQLANQDPMKPMDQKEFAADLAQFSQLEQLANLNTKFDKMGSNAPSQNKFYGASFLGKEVVTKGTSIPYDGKSPQVDIPFYLPKAANKLLVRIFDDKKQMIQQLELEPHGKGQQLVSWDGISLDGTPAVKGNYTVDVRGWDNTMNEFKGETQSKGYVTGVHFDEKGETVFALKNGKQVYLRDVVSFKMPENENNAQGQKLPTLQKQAKAQYNKMNEAVQ